MTKVLLLRLRLPLPPQVAYYLFTRDIPLATYYLLLIAHYLAPITYHPLPTSGGVGVGLWRLRGCCDDDGDRGPRVAPQNPLDDQSKRLYSY